ncbi:GNAT family N-acetyltransferase [Rossellomorea aquimaris]|uniref:GNAT family N-acetyltransferase n=1 Tax=Rossellomorea aquimaris TaxID=189382 RepID=A0A1J6WYV0_9BACI|nr:GNAT family protein [Rossellomorea aquimaris]OIU73007.1 GNAT family N-acetyltransferase [Rossellomorea aquimaris]
MNSTSSRVTLRKIEEKDLETLWDYIYKEEAPEWKQWDAPYFEHKPMPFEDYKRSFLAKLEQHNDRQRIIEVEGNIIGTVSFYWEYEPTRWLEAGIVIYNPGYWNGGYGTEALSQWVQHLFESKEIGRVGITTWSGNERMMKAAEKVGMKIEGRMRKCRYYNGVYYDSIRMGIIREEWDQLYSR